MTVTSEKKPWLAKSSAGRKPVFESPEVLAALAAEYFEWCVANPLLEAKLCSYQGDHRLVDVPHMRPFTVMGMCTFLDIVHETWRNYKSKPEFIGVISAIEAIIYEQKFSGAASNLMNASIIARDLGLKDTSDVNVKGTVTLSFDKDDELV